MEIKNIVFMAIILVPFQIWPCLLSPEINKIVSDKEVRRIDDWIISVAPQSIKRDIGGVETTIPLNWSGFIYHVAFPDLDCPSFTAPCASCKITGFHHDFLGHIQNSGLVQFKNIIGHPRRTVYHADIAYKGLSKNSTFFPKDWPLKQVAQEIITAARNAKVIKHSINGSTLEGTASDGTPITLLIEKNGKVGSAYPVINT